MYRRCCQVLAFLLSVCLLFENSLAAMDLSPWQPDQQQAQEQAQAPSEQTTVAGRHHDHHDGVAASADHTTAGHTTHVQLNTPDHGCGCDCDCQSDCMSTCHPGFAAAPVPLLATNNHISRQRHTVPAPRHCGMRLLRPPIAS